jgi:UDP-N-acetyl-D-glucosamine dehydrogenase
MAKAGHRVFGYDSNNVVIDQLLKGITFVPGVRENELKELINTKAFIPSNNSNCLTDSEVIVIAVPTPLDRFREPDLSFLKSAVTEISKKIKSGTLLVNESTSYPGTLRNFIKPIIQSHSQVKVNYASAPERVDPGNEKWELKNTPRIVSGLTKESSTLVFEFYSTFCDIVHQVGSPEIAEASKIFENTFRQVNIALANEFSNISAIFGFSAHEAISAASTKPFGFMPFWPSIGVGGHCIPVDPLYLTFAVENLGLSTPLISLASTINLEMVGNVVDRIEKFVGKSLSESKIQIAGIAYKSDVSDTRESSGILLLNELRKRGARTSFHDPLVKYVDGEQSVSLSPNVDIGLIVTPHKNIDFSIWKNSTVRVLDLSPNSSNFGWPKFL